MAQKTYIGQAQIETQVEDEPYEVGDIVVFKSGGVNRYLVESLDGEKVTLRPLHEHTWTPMTEWFVKEGSVE